MSILYLLLGFVFVVFGGKYLVNSSVQIARHYKLSSMVVGLTVVAFGTSAPELWVSFGANITGHSDIAIGNVLGSNIANIALVLACVAVIYPIQIISKTILRDWLFMFVLTALALLFLSNNTLSRIESGILFLILIAFIYVSLTSKKAESCDDTKEDGCVPPTMTLWKAIILVFLSCITLSFGSDFLVRGASGIALYFGVDERIISISLIAFGTSIPELSTSIIAAVRKEMDISVGNIIGSNIFNIGAVFGITGLAKPIETADFISRYHIDMIMVTVVSIILMLFIVPLYKAKITRIKGALYLALYSIYIAALFFNII
jgi:cation:H+ antiporter